jgi:hypothetical protein
MATAVALADILPILVPVLLAVGGVLLRVFFEDQVKSFFGRPILRLSVEGGEHEVGDDGGQVPVLLLRIRNTRRGIAAEGVAIQVEHYRLIDASTGAVAAQHSIGRSLQMLEEGASRSVIGPKGRPLVELVRVAGIHPDLTLLLNLVGGGRPIAISLAADSAGEPVIELDLILGADRVSAREYRVRISYTHRPDGAGALAGEIVGVKPEGEKGFDPRRRALVRGGLAAAASLIAVAVALALIIGGGGDDVACAPGLTEPSAADDRAARIGPASRRPRHVKSIPVGTNPATVATGREGVWVGSNEGLDLIDTDRRRKKGTRVVTPEPVYAIALSKDRVWATLRDKGQLIAIDRRRRRIVGDPISFGSASADVTVGGGAVWVNNFKDRYDGNISRIDPCSRSVQRIPVEGTATAVKFAADSVWVSNENRAALIRVSPEAREAVETVDGVDDPQDIAFDGRQLWVNEYTPLRIGRVDPQKPEGMKVVGTLPGGPDPGAIGVSRDAVWQPLYGNSRLRRVLKRRERSVVTADVQLRSPTDIAFADGLIWIPNNGADYVAAIRP